jgi:TonB-dependent receptor
MKSVTVFFLAKVVLLWACVAGPFFAFAQDSRLQIKTENLTKTQDEGQILIVVFRDGMPASEVAIQTPQGILTTNAEGVLSLNLPAQKQQLEVVSTGQSFDVQVVANEEVQVTIHLLDGQKSQADIQTPADSKSPQKIVAAKCKLRMKVISRQMEGIADATILFSGIDTVFKTDAQGNFLGDVPQGDYAMSVFHPNYQTKTITQVKIEPDMSTLSVELKAAQNELEEVVVLAPKIKGSLSALVEVRKQSSAVTDVLGAEQMARAGDSDAAASLRRVTGLTLVGGKYVYVRGLGERYSGVQMNGFSLPSPEPARRVVPLDLFPTAIMESIVVQKSYSPDLPGEFGGGVIQLKTRTLPEKFFFRGNISMVYENINNRLEHQGGDTDWLGFDDGTRKLPSVIQNTLAQGKQLEVNTPGFNNGVTQQELVQMGLSLPNNYDVSRTDNPSMPGLSMSLGNGWKQGRYKIGTSGSLMYGQSTDQLERVVRTYNLGANNKLERDTERLSEYSEIETRVAGSYDLGFELGPRHKISASTFVLRNTTKLTQIDETSFVSTPATQSYTADFTERQLWARHLKGDHELFKISGTPIQLDWRLGWADAIRESPGRQELAYLYTGGSKNLLDNQSGNRRIDSELFDNSIEQALNLTVPIQKDGSDWFKFKVGFLQIEKERTSDINRFYFASANTVSIDKQNPKNTFSDQNIQDGTVVLKNITNDADSYKGEQTVQAQYAMVDYSPSEKWTLLAGIRRENSLQTVNTFKYFDEGNPSSFSSIRMNDLLPAYGIVWKPTDKIRARVTYSETLARPDFREMSTVGFIDDETGNIVQGNAQLNGTVIKNIDHRWEYYFTSDEYASIGFFYKEFENPIEILFLPGVNRIQTFDNAKAAQNFGIEFEGRIGLRNFSRPLRRWTVLSNLTYIESEIELNEQNLGTQTSRSRPLQGQSPYVVNFQLQYDRPQWGLSTTLLYNVVGKRIIEVGTNGIPDTYEQPFEQLDLVATKRIGQYWSLSLRARNLLDPEIESTQSNEVVRSQKRGRIYGLVLGAVF